MANKKKIEQRKAQEQTQKTSKVVRIVAIALLAMVVITAIIILVTARANRKSLEAASIPTLAIVPQETSAPVEQPEVSNQNNQQPKQYDKYPAMEIDQARKYLATFKMENGGEFTAELYPDKAPLAVNSFVFLARNGFFDGVTFHRVLEGFMAQGGDPTGTGMGGPGYEFANEDSDLTFDKAGVLAMANAGRDTNGSQFFITFAPAEFLNGGYTIFGQIVSGMDFVNNITRRDPEQNPTFLGDAIKTIIITEQ